MHIQMLQKLADPSLDNRIWPYSNKGTRTLIDYNSTFDFRHSSAGGASRGWVWSVGKLQNDQSRCAGDCGHQSPSRRNGLQRAIPGRSLVPAEHFSEIISHKKPKSRVIYNRRSYMTLLLHAPLLSGRYTLKQVSIKNQSVGLYSIKSANVGMNFE